MKTQNTRRAFFMSLVSLLLCFTMMLGSTLAWFTDSVVVKGNRIVAGNLDVELYYDNASTTGFADASETGAKMFVDKNGDEILWEPGVVAYTNFKVANVGNLALKYTLNTIVTEEVTTVVDGVIYSLQDVIKVAVLFGETVDTREAAIAKAVAEGKTIADIATKGQLLEQNEVDECAVVLYWEPNADEIDNKYNLNNDRQGDDALEIVYDIRLVATQLTYEDDSFDDQYDADAAFSVWNGTIPTEMPESLVVDPATRTITVNDADAFAYLQVLDDNWVALYSNGQGTDYSNYATQNGGKGVDYYYHWDWDVVLNCDIDLANKAWTPLNLDYFANFNGQGHTVKNISVTATENEAGLFSIVSGDVIDLVVENATINAVGYQTAGAVGGSIHGKINNVTVKNAVVTGDKYVGGIVGYGYATINNSNVYDSIITIPATGAKEAGGLAGYLCKSTADAAPVKNNEVKNTIISAPSVASALVSQPNANFVISFNKVENVTVTTTDDTADIFVSNNVGDKSVVGDNTEVNCTVNKAGALTSLAFVDDTADLKTAANTKNTTVVLAPGDYTTVALAEGVTLVGSEGTVIKQGAGSEAALGSTKNTTVKNVEFVGTNAQRWGYAGGEVVFENCTFKGEGTEALSWAIHYDGLGGANILYKNCDIYGWVAIGGGAGSLVFDGCNFYGNGAFGLCRAYSDFTVKNCTFDYSNVDPNGTRSVGIQAISGAVCTVENCTNVNGDIYDIINVDYKGTQYEGSYIVDGVAYNG